MKWVWLMLGGLSLLVALIGIVLPLLPTTPFVIVALACFTRGSARAQHWLLSHPLFGPLLDDWLTYRGMRRGVKWRASVLIVLSFAFSLYWLYPQRLSLLLPVLMLVLLSYIWTRPEPPDLLG